MDTRIMDSFIAVYEKAWKEQFTIMKAYYDSDDSLPDHEHNKQRYNYCINALINQRKGIENVLAAMGYKFLYNAKTEKYYIEKI